MKDFIIMWMELSQKMRNMTNSLFWFGVFWGILVLVDLVVCFFAVCFGFLFGWVFIPYIHYLMNV